MLKIEMLQEVIKTTFLKIVIFILFLIKGTEEWIWSTNKRNTIDIRIKDWICKVEIWKNESFEKALIHIVSSLSTVKFEKCTSTTDEKSHRLIILLCYTSQESPSLKRQFFKRFNKNLIMLISILVLIETSLKGNGCNLTNSDRNHRNVSGITQ